METTCRAKAWMYLLHYVPFYSSAAERDALISERRKEYQRIKESWNQSILSNEPGLSRLKDEKLRIGKLALVKSPFNCWFMFFGTRTILEKDVLRTDRHIECFKADGSDGLEKLLNILMSYAVQNPTIGYVQGMNDLLSPIFAVIENEADAFWCFLGLMKDLQPNFHHNQKGMHSKLTSLAHLMGLVDPVLFKKFGEFVSSFSFEKFS